MVRKALTLPRRWWSRFAVEADAVAATEYAILLAVLVVVSAGTIRSIGEKFFNLYTAIANAVGSTM